MRDDERNRSCARPVQRRWDNGTRSDEDGPIVKNGERDTGRAEVLVRFKSGISDEAIQGIADRLHDTIEDRIESVDGLDIIEDEDGSKVDDVVAQYRALPEVE